MMSVVFPMRLWLRKRACAWKTRMVNRPGMISAARCWNACAAMSSAGVSIHPDRFSPNSAVLSQTAPQGFWPPPLMKTARPARATGVKKEGRVVKVVGNIMDITRLKQAEAEREKLLIQLSQKEKMESIGRLAGGVAHDFNNMLGVILGNTELAMLQTDEDYDLYRTLKEIQKAAQRSADLTKQLLTFARKDLISPRQLDLNDTVESRLNMLRRLIGDEISLVWKPGTSL